MVTQELQQQIRLADNINTRIRQARTSRGYSHDQLGQLIGGVSRQHLIKLEAGKHRPRAAMLQRIAQATGQSIDWFLNGKDGGS